MKFVQNSASIQVNNDLEIAHPHSVCSSTSLGRIVILTNNKLNPHMMSTPEFENGPRWWEANALSTTLSLAPSLLLCLQQLRLEARNGLCPHCSSTSFLVAAN